MPIKIDERSALGENSKLVRLYEGKKSEEARPVAAAVNDDDFQLIDDEQDNEQ